MKDQFDLYFFSEWCFKVYQTARYRNLMQVGADLALVGQPDQQHYRSAQLDALGAFRTRG